MAAAFTGAWLLQCAAVPTLTLPDCHAYPQEIARPDIFWYDAPTKIDLPFNIVGLLAFEFFAMHFVELKRWQDFRNPGSVDADPLFPNNKLAPHEVRPPGCVWEVGELGWFSSCSEDGMP